MNLEIITNENILEKFNITDHVISAMKDRYMPLSIKGIEDKAGYLMVKEARLTIKSKRVEVEKIRKELKEDALRYGRIVDAEAKRITALLEPIEHHLSEEQSRIDNEKENIRLEKERKKRELFQNRIDSFRKYDFIPTDLLALEQMTEEEFEKHLDQAKILFEEKQKRLAEIEAEKKAQEEKIRVENERLANVAAEQRAAQEKIEADRKAIEDEKSAIENKKIREEEEKKRQLEIEKHRAEAAEKQRLEVEEKHNREAAEKIEREKLLESLRPDREKLIKLSIDLSKVHFPTVTTDEAKNTLKIVKQDLTSILVFIQNFTSFK